MGTSGGALKESGVQTETVYIFKRHPRPSVPLIAAPCLTLVYFLLTDVERSLKY